MQHMKLEESQHPPWMRQYFQLEPQQLQSVLPCVHGSSSSHTSTIASTFRMVHGTSEPAASVELYSCLWSKVHVLGQCEAISKQQRIIIAAQRLSQECSRGSSTTVGIPLYLLWIPIRYYNCSRFLVWYKWTNHSNIGANTPSISIHEDSSYS